MQDPDKEKAAEQAKKDEEAFRQAAGKVTLEAFKQEYDKQNPELAQIHAEQENSLAGFNFGTGIAATFDMHKGKKVDKASLVDDGTGQSIIRIDAEGNAAVGLILETHYFWMCGRENLIGHGPFFAIKSDDTQPIDALGFGWMVGMRRETRATNSFNIGLGVMIDPDAQVLADGYVPNMPPPAGATDVMMKTEERFSLALLFSYTF